MEADRSLHVALVYPHLDRPGGVERYVRELARQLLREHRVTVVTAGEPAGLPAGCRVVRVRAPRRPRFLASFAFALASRATLRRLRCDVVNVHGANGFGAEVVTAHSCHRAWYRRSLRALPRWSRAWWLKLLNPVHPLTLAVERAQYRPGGCRRIVAVSDSVRADLVEHYRVPPSRIAVVQSGVDAEAFSRARHAASRAGTRRALGFSDADLVLLFVGNEPRRKGLETLLEALARLGRADLGLLVVGAADPRPFEERARALGVRGRVVFAGSVERPERLYAASDAFVFPTRYEAFSLGVLEAMASGLPVVTSRTGGAEGLIEPDGAGILLSDPGDPVELAGRIEALLDPAVREAMGRRARARAEAFTWEAVAVRTVAEMRRALAFGPRAGAAPRPGAARVG